LTTQFLARKLWTVWFFRDKAIAMKAAYHSVLLMVILSMVGSTLWCFPYQLSYFNELAGSTPNGWRHMLGSSFDWGQDLLALERLASRKYAGIRIDCIPQSNFDVPQVLNSLSYPEELLGAIEKERAAGLIAVSRSVMCGDSALLVRRSGYRYLSSENCRKFLRQDAVVLNSSIPTMPILEMGALR